MKAITLHQPWATLIADGTKTIETRSWTTRHRGPLAIHAAKTVDAGAAYDCGYEPADLPRGEIVAIVELVAVLPASMIQIDPDTSRQGWRLRDPRGTFAFAHRREWVVGDLSPGRYGWLLRRRYLPDGTYPARGRQGLWTWDQPLNFGVVTP